MNGEEEDIIKNGKRRSKKCCLLAPCWRGERRRKTTDDVGATEKNDKRTGEQTTRFQSWICLEPPRHPAVADRLARWRRGRRRQKIQGVGLQHNIFGRENRVLSP